MNTTDKLAKALRDCLSMDIHHPSCKPWNDKAREVLAAYEADAKPAPADERAAFEKLVPHMGTMTNYHVFQAGVRFALEAKPAPAPDAKAIRAIFQAGRDSYATPCVPMNSDDEAWQEYAEEHGIGKGGAA
jgi:hypothetical protein